MRIDGFQNIPAVLQSLRAGRLTDQNSSSESPGESSSVKLSSFGSILQALQREAASQSKVRESKVNVIADAVQNGTLKMDMNRLASKLVDLQVIDFKD
jgi:flagellar biosynthesis anti-sigma factor FlgM